jgi:diphthine synthase
VSELWFIGLGLGDERDLSVRAREVLALCEAVFAETYTSALAPGSLERLSGELARPIRTLSRIELEGERPVLEALATAPRVALLVAGDPFAATTHVALRLAVERAGHVWKYLPNASILTAAASFLGLMHYRFGRVVSVPFPEPGFEPRSPLDTIGANRALRLHTLVLLDLRPSEDRFLTAGEALRLLAARDSEGPDGVLPPNLPVAVVARVGTDRAEGWFGTRAELQEFDFGPPLHAIVIPSSDLHFEEAEALRRFQRSPKP